MTSNASIVLVGIALCLCSPLSGSLAAASPVANKLLFGIASDDKICPDKNIIVESRYVKNCDEAKLPSGHLNLTVEDPERFLCLGVYDRIATLCYLDSLGKGGRTVLPENSTEFDSLVAKLPATNEESYEFCSRPKNPYPPRYEKTKEYAEQLNRAMAKPGLCIKMCVDDDGNFNRLCSVIAAIEDISLHVAHSSETSPKQETKDTVKDAVKEKPVEHTVKAESTVEEPVPEKPKEAAGKSEDKSAPKPGPSTDKEQADKNKKQSKPPAPPQPQPQHPEPAPKIAKPAAVSPPAAPKETPKNEKENKIEEPETAAKPPGPEADVGSDKKSDVQPPTSKNPPIAADKVPIAGEDVSDGYIGGTDNNGQLPDDPTNGEQISEHTQELEDQDVGEEPNETDPPLPPPNEQVEESPPVPSEKREFVPRMPSIRNDDDSHFFGYFTVIGVICIAGYVGYHNKQKILAMVLEGRRSRGGRGRRRPSTANYRKLDCTLEEAVTSQCNSNVTHVIY